MYRSRINPAEQARRARGLIGLSRQTPPPSPVPARHPQACEKNICLGNPGKRYRAGFWKNTLDLRETFFFNAGYSKESKKNWDFAFIGLTKKTGADFSNFPSSLRNCIGLTKKTGAKILGFRPKSAFIGLTKKKLERISGFSEVRLSARKKTGSA